MAIHEDLLGYLLGALSEAEMQRVAALLRENPMLRAELEKLKETTDRLEEAYVPIEPPPVGLTDRTLDLIDRHQDSGQEKVIGSPESASKASSFSDRVASHVSQDDSIKLGDAKLSSELNNATSHRWLDWIGAVAAAVVVLGILLPALANGRFESRKVACQDQLRRLGVALTQFVNRTPEQRLPAVAESGPEAFAGVYALRLHDSGLMPDANLRWCPSLPEPDPNEATLVNLGELDRIEDLQNVSVNQLHQIQQYSGGHYAYNLGVLEEERFTSPKFEARASFAVMADTPMIGNLGVDDLGRSEQLAKWIGHGGRGINVLFEDGAVRFIPVEALRTMPDHPLLNHEGQVEAGVNIDDATLAPSWRAPFLNVPQR